MKMKKSFPMLLLLLCLYATAIAQRTEQNPGSFEFGANIGYNSSTVTTGQLTNTTPRIGFNLGISADYYFSDRWSIRVRLIDDPKGWNNGFISTSNGSYTTNYRLNYLTIPVMANWHFARKRNWYLHFGPYIGILMNASETATGMNLKTDFNSTDFGIDLGIGVKIPVSDNLKIFIEDDAQAGATDIFKVNSSGSPVLNSRSSIKVGVNFSLN
jgi:opacity protein-like surface antigen